MSFAGPSIVSLAGTGLALVRIAIRFTAAGNTTCHSSPRLAVERRGFHDVTDNIRVAYW
ncbi:hypothetical protein PF005_g971 [Phytophthora fragariae]|uniref:Uncharacterized protein n=2 Tax=Phytophthora TaxID=4783 RepID=A0A6A3SLL8_9STRA|nr:hypothetical protein PF003_g27095 [Phytophthora fragariae]KAE8957920.1 hypothetical protein PR002_g31031 [Phytophthora rubi]KAE8914071.1 hypothetical protein PF003_g1290 [Phytophthora fragariae]KAE8941122.1 hypothetical protein PF009_g9082 [Phytophthora fragariae]KAE9057398.1 hypothetical protein PF006_g32426 [Phytophthora fragariae]